MDLSENKYNHKSKKKSFFNKVHRKFILTYFEKNILMYASLFALYESLGKASQSMVSRLIF